MKNIYRTELIIDDRASNENRLLIEKYWAMDNKRFVHKIGDIADDAQLRSSYLNKIIREYSKLKIKSLCISCNQQHENEVYSRNKALPYFKSQWICDSCRDMNETRKREEEERIIKETLDSRKAKFQIAIESRVWEQFDKNELFFLIKLLQIEDVQQLRLGLDKTSNEDYRRVLEKAANYGLVDLVLDEKSSILEYHVPEKAFEMVSDYREKLLVPIYEATENVNNPHLRLSFKIMKNNYHKTSDDAVYVGEIAFDSDMLIKKGNSYRYTVYTREDGNAWFSIHASDSIIGFKNISDKKR